MLTIALTICMVALVVVVFFWAGIQFIAALIHRPDRDHHEWQPSINLAEELVDRYRARNN